MHDQVTRRAYAKVNLALAVGPALPAGHAKAGFHPIASWMACIDLFDEISVTRAPDGQESTHALRWAGEAPRQSPLDWPLEKDLAVRAHRLLEQQARRRLPLNLDLLKRIPVGGGLGGGSSDAASALLAINDLFRLGLDLASLADLGAALGSDVSFFIDDHQPPRPALVTGTGNSVTRADRVHSGVVVLIPPFGTPTAPVYRAFDAHPTAGVDQPRLERALRAQLNPRELFNDLSSAASQIEPRLTILLDQAGSIAGSPALLSGSGSSVFVLCAGGEEARLAQTLAEGLARRGRELSAPWLTQARIVPSRLV